MNLYEISATLENGAVHKTKIYEINQERALNRASKFALQFDATGCAKKTVQRTSASTARPRLMRCACWVRWETLEARKMTIDELRILRGLSMTKLCEAAGLSMGAVFKLTRPGAELERARLGTVMKLAAGLGAVITVDPEGVTIRPKEENR